jgi:hypothetical protein
VLVGQREELARRPGTGRSQSPGVLAGCFSRRSVIDAHPLHGMGDVSKAIEAATMILRASVRRHRSKLGAINVHH